MEEYFELQDQQEKLAHAFIEEYLRGEGYSLKALGTLSPERVRQLMVKAAVYASTKLAEIGDRAHMMTSIHHGTESIQ